MRCGCEFDEQRLVSDAGLLVTATLADRLGIEELVNESVWLGYRVPGAALPGRKVMSLVHGMLAGADSIDDMNVLRAGSTGLVLGHRVMAPSTLGTFLRAFTFGHVRQLDRVLDVALARAWEAGAGPGRAAVGDRYRQLHRRGPRRSEAGRRPTGTPASSGITRSSRSAPIPARCCTSATAKGKANTQRGAARFVDELLARVRRAGHTGPIVIRADSGFENHKLMRALDRQGVEFSIGVKQSKTIRALIDQIPETDWVTVADYPDTGEAQIAETRLGGWRLIVRRTRLVGKQAELFPDWRHHAFATNRTVPMLDRRHRSPRPRHDRAGDPRPQRPSPRALPVRPATHANSAWTVIAALAHNLGRWTTQIGLPDRPVQTARSRRRHLLQIPGPPDPHQPPMDTPDARPLAMADRLHHHPRRDPRAPRPHLTGPGARRGPARPARRHTARSPLPETPAETLPPRTPRRPTTTNTEHDNRRHTPSPARPTSPTSPTQPIGGFRFRRSTEQSCRTSPLSPTCALSMVLLGQASQIHVAALRWSEIRRSGLRPDGRSTCDLKRRCVTEFCVEVVDCEVRLGGSVACPRFGRERRRLAPPGVVMTLPSVPFRYARLRGVVIRRGHCDSAVRAWVVAGCGSAVPAGSVTAYDPAGCSVRTLRSPLLRPS